MYRENCYFWCNYYFWKSVLIYSYWKLCLAIKYFCTDLEDRELEDILIFIVLIFCFRMHYLMWKRRLLHHIAFFLMPSKIQLRVISFLPLFPVKRCSEMLLADLEKRWQESVRISKLSDIILKHAHNHSQAYVKYCSNQIYQDRILKELKWVYVITILLCHIGSRFCCNGL